MYSWLKDAIARDAVIVTASRRLARNLQSWYAGQQLATGQVSWATPSIMVWSDWCNRQLATAGNPAELPVPVGGFSSAILWERCIRKISPDDVPAVSGIVRQARDSWQRLNDWQVPLAALTESARSQDERLFAAAATAYQSVLQASAWEDRDNISRLVVDLLASDRADIPQQAVLAGFDRYSPAVTAVMKALETAGCAVQVAPYPDSGGQISVACCDDHDAEMRAAGAWARDILMSTPDARVAIVSPSLHNDADRSARLVREGLAPGWQYGGAAWRAAVDVSYGRIMAEYPAVATALLILRWIHHGLPTKDISLLLRSKCLASNSGAGRSRLELALRMLPDRSWTAAGLLRAQQGKDDSADSLRWFHGLQAIIALQQDDLADASPAHWARCMDSLLNEWRWPGEATLTSNEFQLINRWRELLNELAGATIVCPKLQFSEAVRLLASLASETVFQPQAEAGVVSLMGTLEAAGLEFDHIWVSGMHAAQWPPAGNPSSLLARELQREYGMPDATPADTLEFSRRVLNRLLCSATTVVLSWPRSDGESALVASSLLDELDYVDYAGAPDPGWHAASFCSGNASTIATDDPVPAVAADEIITGGAYTVQLQSVEPIAAFIYGRLGVRRPAAIEPGISPGVAGNIIHNALHTLFADHPAQSDIKRWDAADIERRLGSAIDSALAEHLRHANTTYMRLLGLERTRLFRLLRNFIAAEIERPEFTVAEVEKPLDFSAFGIRLKLRIDRIDRLADGALLVIDYKTGMPKNLLNRDGDLLDLQLAVYADALQETIGGLALINVDSRSISYKGTGGSVAWDIARRDQWPQRLDAWRADVHRALRELAAGDVRINLQRSAEEGRHLNILSRLEEHKRAY